MRKPWHTPHSIYRGVVLTSILVASLAVASAQPSGTNPPAPPAQAATNLGPGMDFMSRGWTNSRPGISPILTPPRKDADQLEVLKRRAEQGGARDQCSLGLAYYWGSGVAQSYAEAVKWYRKAAEQGNADAQYNLGVCYTEGQGVERDYTEATKWYRKAAEQGSALAQYNLGVCYTEGQGVEKDYTEAAKWWRKAAEQDDAQAQCNLAVCYSLGQGMTKDYAEAVKWFRKAAEQGDSFGQLSLAFCYEEGNGVTKDYAEAATWYRKAAEQGNPSAQYNLGVCYTEGQGVDRDYAEAVRWWRRAADQGNDYAQMSLAFCYADANGVAKDAVESYKWLSLAAAQGNTGALRWRDLIAADMTKEDIAEAQRRSAAFVARKETPNLPHAAIPGASPAGQPTAQPSGSGFFVTEDGWLVTSFHVVEGAAHILVRTEKVVLPAKLISADKVNDVAILKASGSFPALPVGPSRAAKLGETVLTVGFPGIGLQGFAMTVTKGEISGLTGVRDDPREFQISVALQSKDSGAPLVNQYGNVVGIVEARPAENPALNGTNTPQNVNYAVKSSVLSVLLESLPEVSSKLKEPYPPKDRKLEEVVNETKSATARILVY